MFHLRNVNPLNPSVKFFRHGLQPIYSFSSTYFKRAQAWLAHSIS